MTLQSLAIGALTTHCGRYLATNADVASDRAGAT
jgi:hypothetical protein